MSIPAKAAPAQREDSRMSALEVFRTGRDYIEIAALLGMSVPSVESEIHRLRSAEKGDAAGHDHAGAETRRFARRPLKPGTPVNFAGDRVWRRRV
ncbi:sigma-70 family RNA polymerase sigma factor [Rhizobium chutanense]|uniref:Sigma-70 family RNA polymerase sigma factor n=1 Tax=Rhizobium chutanense TaxID=2035448 RepID=A0A432P3V8_9HYPH|nr:sigma-70 family RNA polymerase sigma factor [Rhizobium chutanense]RUM06849.1 sigma-70 family RNA polymerase sigma factor [Rhizobium chutanense]